MGFTLGNCVPSAGPQKRKRVGRGIGSGRGKTCGRGVKGQKARTGVSLNGFEGGQQPYVTSLPKRGFKNPSRKPFIAVNLGFIQSLVEAVKLPVGHLIDKNLLVKAGFIKRVDSRVKVLGHGDLGSGLVFDFDAFSVSALQKIKDSGGAVLDKSKLKAVGESEGEG